MYYPMFYSLTYNWTYFLVIWKIPISSSAETARSFITTAATSTLRQNRLMNCVTPPRLSDAAIGKADKQIAQVNY